jgi:predicted nucleic acid-binding protein
MTTAIDTNVVTALWNADDALNRRAQAALDTVFGRGRLVVSGVVYAELLAAPSRTEQFVDRFLDAAGIEVEWEINERLLRAAGLAFRGYAERRRRQKGVEPRRILADFLVGAHATLNEYRLLTLDTGMYRAAFPRLELVEV